MNLADIESLIDITRWASDRGYTIATGGNFSVRADQSSCWVTASGVDKSLLTPTQFIRVDWQHQILDGTGKPSDETGIHTQLYQLDPNIQVVMHIHSIASTVLSRLCETDYLMITGWEMQKALAGISSHQQTVSLAVFDNNQDIAQLSSQLAARWRQAPLQWGLLVRGHGLYAWSYSIEQAAKNLQGLDFLLNCELQLAQLNSSRKH